VSGVGLTMSKLSMSSLGPQLDNTHTSIDCPQRYVDVDPAML